MHRENGASFVCVLSQKIAKLQNCKIILGVGMEMC